MDGEDFKKTLGSGLSSALEKKGYTTLTSVQTAVLDPALEGRDLRISSTTGSGKTLAIGFAIRALVMQGVPNDPSTAHPLALIVAPTRELAKQSEEELGWFFAPVGVRVASATGGASYRTERRALGSGPAIVVGTPGRLLDHLRRGVIDCSKAGAVILDEADRMLDMGFRDELEEILSFAPKERITHLVSATFPREVKSLADRIQNNPVSVEGTRLGEANADIDHVVHLIDPHQRVDAIVNLLLANPDEDTLVFARTRAEVAEIAQELNQSGFSVASLSGDLDQNARDRALNRFKKGDVRVLVATDVAARGIDVQGISRVIHAEPPSDPDSYTHRSGRTGRAGRKGTSSVLRSVIALRRTLFLLKSAKVVHRFEPIPTAETITASNDEKIFVQLTVDDVEGYEGIDERTWALAKRLAAAGETTRLLARLLSRSKVAGLTKPRNVRAVLPPTERAERPRAVQSPDGYKPSGARRERGIDNPEDWVGFHISWGSVHGADARRLLAVVCRRGGIQGNEVGAIRIGPTFSVVEVRKECAEAFANASKEPDPRNPKVTIRKERKPPAGKNPDSFAAQRAAFEDQRERRSIALQERAAIEEAIGGPLPYHRGKRAERGPSRPEDRPRPDYARQDAVRPEFPKQEDRPSVRPDFAKQEDRPSVRPEFPKQEDRPSVRPDFARRDDKPYGKPADRPYVKAADKPYAKRAEKPYVKSADSPVEKRVVVKEKRSTVDDRREEKKAPPRGGEAAPTKKAKKYGKPKP